MARRQAPLQVNEFTGGLNTEFNPLSMPPNISIDELNMEISNDGSRIKREGFDFEPDHTEIETNVPFQSNKQVKTHMFRWDNAGGIPEKSLMVVQIGNYLAIHDMDTVTNISGETLYSETFDVGLYETTFSFTVLDGILVGVNSEKDVLIYEYNGTSISKSTDTLLIRDLFGVDDPNLTEQRNLSVRPSTLSNKHTYNLRNRTFYSPRFKNNTETLKDPILSFKEDSGGEYPSNADNLNQFLFADPNDNDNRIIERFFSKNMVKEAPSTGESPIGHFIIDALDRGQSRQEEEEHLRNRNPKLTYSVGASSLPVDKTPGGASVIEQFAGRVWYGGFSSELIGGDPKSPRMSSYLLFSSLVRDKTDITQCYQLADPTSNEDSAIVDADGGFIRIESAYGIRNMINLESSLFVFASNGIWRVSGGESSPFTATNFQVNKISNEGVVSRNSVVAVGSQIFYWGEKGIFNISQNEFGFWQVVDITEKTIKTFYLDISQNTKRTCNGFYEPFENKIRWIYTEPTVQVNLSHELVLDLQYQAFTPLEIPVRSDGVPSVLNSSARQPFKLTSELSNVTAGGVLVTVSGDAVTSQASFIEDSLRSGLYLVISGYKPTLQYSFGYYYDEDRYDWGDVEYDAYLVTGALTGGEGRFKKQTPYLNIFFRKTEDGFDVDFNPTNNSSCMLSSRWNWTTSNNTNKWSTPREAYRYSNLYFPSGPSDIFDTGETVIVTKNKIRGWGYSVSFRFEAVPGKNLHIHGWSFDLTASVKE